jgi:uncharacterized damage-inducible protein DinB
MHSLAKIYEGWDGYQTSLVRAAEPLTPEQLAFRTAPHRRSVGELVRHISFGRLTWFRRMAVPGVEEVAARVPQWFTDREGNRHAVEESAPADDRKALLQWLHWSWLPIRRVLTDWTTNDLATTYRHRYQGKTYAVSHQWTIWRIMAHDIHHGGQIAMLLATQGIRCVELGLLGGHLTEPEEEKCAESE